MKKALSITLVVVMLFSAFTIISYAAEKVETTSGFDNFVMVYDYIDGKFSDVKKEDWFSENVNTAYYLGLVKGVSDTQFNPDGNVTLAETVALACRLHSIYSGINCEFVQGTPWYQVYIDYAADHGIITFGEYSNYNSKATREQFAMIFAKCMPEEALVKINDITSIPDVPYSYTSFESVLLLYRAGILTGNDKFGTFDPSSNIKRSEVATIVTRMAKPSAREAFTPEREPVAATGIEFDCESYEVEVGKVLVLRPTILPEDSTETDVAWTSSDKSVAFVNNGVVSGRKEGSCTITATIGDFSAKCTVTVLKEERSEVIEYINKYVNREGRNSSDGGLNYFSNDGLIYFIKLEGERLDDSYRAWQCYLTSYDDGTLTLYAEMFENSYVHRVSIILDDSSVMKAEFIYKETSCYSKDKGVTASIRLKKSLYDGSDDVITLSNYSGRNALKKMAQESASALCRYALSGLKEKILLNNYSLSDLGYTEFKSKS